MNASDLRQSEAARRNSTLLIKEGVPEIQEEEIELGEVPTILGEGCFGVVVKGKCRGVNVAIKLPKFEEVTEEQLMEFMEEVRVMSKLYHPNIALFMGAMVDKDSGEIKIVTELLDYDIGSLLADGGEGQSYSLFHRMQLAKQVAEGMAWIHGSNMVHRDLKPSNILYSIKTDTCKVIDFGFTLLQESKETLEGGGVKGTPFWIAPETLRGKGCSTKSDVYSFAIILHFLVTRKPNPYAERSYPSVAEFFKDVLEGVRPKLPDKIRCPESLRSLIERCWHDDPEQRPRFEEVIQFLEKEVLVDCAIYDQKGRSFWKKKFRSASGDLHTRVAWGDFEYEFSSRFGETKRPLSTTNASYHCLLTLFASRDEVDIEHFGRAIGFFGPLCTGWIDQVTTLMSKTWFWGDTDRKEACQKLSNHQEKSFLVRFASSDADYTISYVAKNKGRSEIYHTRVNHSYCSKEFELPHGRKSVKHKSLTALVEALMASPKSVLAHPCPGGPYEGCFANLDKDNGYGGPGMGAYQMQGNFYGDDDDDLSSSSGARALGMSKE